MMMAACFNEEILPSEDVKNPAEPTLTIIAIQGEDADSHVVYNPCADGRTVNQTWTEGDAIYVTDGTCVVELPLTDGADTDKGTFSTEEELPFAEDASLVAYYKNEGLQVVSEFGTTKFRLVFDASLLGISQTSNGDMEHLARMNNMVSTEEFVLSAGRYFNLKFERMGVVVPFSLIGLGGKTITKLSLVAEESVFTQVLMKMTMSGGSVLQYRIVAGVNLLLGTDGAGITLSADERFTAYLMLGATEKLTNGMTLTLYATASDGSVYKASVNGGKLKAGKKYMHSKVMTPFKFFDEGEGTEASPYLISTAQHLKDLSSYIKSGFSMKGIHFKLKNDINLSSECGEGIGNWIPRIGTVGVSYGADNTLLGFKGTFDGDGKTIFGLYFNDAEERDVALFGCIAVGGTLKNLHVVGDITAYEHSAGLVAINAGTVSGCTFVGSVTTSDFCAGGIVGCNYNVVIGCSNDGRITSDKKWAGGIVGHMSDGSIMACYNTGSINGDTTGGIVGNVDHVEYEATIDACYHTSETPVVGNINEGTVAVSNCYWASGSVTDAVGTGEATVTGGGHATDWTAAMAVMNSALQDQGWKYDANTDAATKPTEPLKLVKE